nr:hypothetical protein BaRGS_018193 [Batillaria attramentaria]
MKKTVDDLDAWYRQHIQQNRKYSAPTLPLTSRRSEGKLVVPGGNAEHLRRKSYDLAADSGKSTRLGLLLNRFNLPNMLPEIFLICLLRPELSA